MQDRAFFEGEGSAWFQRNRDYLIHHWSPSRDWPLRLLDLYHLDPLVVVEVGCAGGHRLAALADPSASGRGYGRTCIGVDASAEAIADGRERYPYLELHHGLATSLPLRDDLADLCIASYLLHWIGRESLLLAAAEIDRVLKVGGHLLVADFAPGYPTQVAYKHKPGLWTWKLPDSYAGLWTSTGRYREIARVTYDHDNREDRTDAPSQQRGACVLLRKESQYVCASP